LTKCRNFGVNSISTDTMASLLIDKNLPYIVVDCRFDYEYKGGKIPGAINLSE